MQTKTPLNMPYASHHCRRGSVNERQVNAYPHRHTRVTSQADSISSDASTSSTLVDTSAADAAPYYYTDDEQLFAQFADMLPIPEHPEPLYPAAASSIMLPDIPDSTSPTPASSCNYLLAPPSPTHQKPPRLWLHRRRRPTPPPSPTPTPTPADARASFLAALLHARWPKSEGDDPIFGRTTPRARSPCRAPTAPRSILTRADSRASRRRGPGSVKFAETPRTFEYACEEGWEEDEDVDDARAATALGTYGERWAEEEEEGGDGDSVITYPPPAQAPKRGAGILKRCFGQSHLGEKEREKGAGERPTISGPFPLARSASMKGNMSSEKLGGERPVISGPFPLARAASMRDMKGNVSSEKLAARSQRERSGSLKEREREKAGSPVKKGGMLRTFWGRLHVGAS